MEHRQYPRHMWTVIVLYLLAVLALTLPMTVSKFESTASGSDTAVVAKFKVNMDYGTKEDGQIWQSKTLNLTGLEPGDTKVFYVKVTNASDVNVKYTVSCETAGNLPLDISYDKATGELAFDDTAEVVVTVTWPSTENDPQYAEEVDYLRVVVNFEQIN